MITAQANRSQVTRRPLSIRYLAFVGGTGLSTMGDAAWMIALTVTVVSLAGPAEAGAVLALAQVPRVIAMLGGGAMSDRRGPVAVMIGADLARFALMAIAALVLALSRPALPVLVVLAAVLALVGSVFVPASGALRPQLLAQEDLVRGNALYLLGLRGGQAAGGPVGAWLFGIAGIVVVAVFDAISFLASAAAVFGCARPARDTSEPALAAAQAQPPLLRRIAEGLRYVSRSRDLTTLMVVIGLVELASSGPVNIGLILLANGMGAGAAGAGLLLTGFTVGSTAAYLLSLVWPVGRRAAIVGAIAIALEGVVLASVGQTPSLWPAVCEYALLGVVGSLASLVLTSLVQRQTDVAVRGRVMSIMSLLTYGAVPAGSLTIGIMIEWLGRGPTMLVQGGLAVVAAVAFCSAPRLRSARLD